MNRNKEELFFLNFYVHNLTAGLDYCGFVVELFLDKM